MILPAFILLADIAAWWLTSQWVAFGETALTTLGVGLSLALLIWLVIEVFQLSEDFRNPKRGARPGPGADDGF